MAHEEIIRRALQFHQAGRLAEAELLYRQVLAADPRHADSLHLLGLVMHQAGRRDAGMDLVRQAIAITPSPEYFCNLGLMLQERGWLPEAVAAWRDALARKPDYANVLNLLGTALRELGRLEESVAAYRRAVAVKPDFAIAFSNLGNVLRDVGRMEESVLACRKAIALMPNFAAAHNNLGNALNKLDRLDEAVASYRQALALKPDYAESRSNLGNALKDLGRLDEGIAAYRQALALNPNLPECHSNLVYDLHYRAEYDPRETLAETLRWSAAYADPLTAAAAPAHANSRDPDRPLRIGYVSADFHNHSVARFFLPLLAHHNRVNFQVYCYSDVRAADSVTQTIRSTAREWRNLVGVPHAAAAEIIRKDGIDILIDLAGHTAQHRLLVFARKPAPVQMTYLGYPGPTGVRAIDYRLTDALADPPGKTESFFSEQLLRLPRTNWCFQPPEDSPDPRTTDHDAIVFGSFNNFAKLTPRLLDLWADILLAVPNSRLLVKAKALADPPMRESFARRFIHRGIDPARLDLRGRLRDQSAHLGAYHDMDIALDSYPYHGTTTTCEALWMGVPVVTLAGKSHVSRVGVSLLTNAGLPQLIAETPEEYVRIAAELAGDRTQLADLRRNLRPKMLASPLMDATAFARDVESAYREAWRKWCGKKES